MSKGIAALFKAKESLDVVSLHILYCSLILPYFGYCKEVLRNTYKTNIRPLCVLENRATRRINKVNVKKNKHTNSIYMKGAGDMTFLFSLLLFRSRNVDKCLVLFCENMERNERKENNSNCVIRCIDMLL